MSPATNLGMARRSLDLIELSEVGRNELEVIAADMVFSVIQPKVRTPQR